MCPHSLIWAALQQTKERELSGQCMAGAGSVVPPSIEITEQISGVCIFAVFGGGPTFGVMNRSLAFFLSEWRVSDSPLLDVHAGGGGGERAIKSLPEQPGMTHTTEFIREGGREAEGEREAGDELTLKDNIWKQAKEEAVVEPHTLIPQHRPKPCQRGERDTKSPLSHSTSLPPLSLTPLL